jgi:hypothetical protein
VPCKPKRRGADVRPIKVLFIVIIHQFSIKSANASNAGLWALLEECTGGCNPRSRRHLIRALLNIIVFIALLGLRQPSDADAFLPVVGSPLIWP